MKALLISASATAALVLGWSAVSTNSAQAYSPPPYVQYEGYTYYLSNYYNSHYCIYETYYYHQYPYCRHHSSYNSGGGYSSGGGGSGY
jgi:hypothetical protein